MHPKLTGLMLSLPTDPFDRSLIPGIIPDPVKLRSILRPIIDRAFALGIVVKAIDGPCGPPLCAFGADRRITSLSPTPGQVEFRKHLPACERCVVKHACFGARTAQLELYGESCVEPILSLPPAGCRGVHGGAPRPQALRAQRARACSPPANKRLFRGAGHPLPAPQLDADVYLPSARNQRTRETPANTSDPRILATAVRAESVPSNACAG